MKLLLAVLLTIFAIFAGLYLYIFKYNMEDVLVFKLKLQKLENVKVNLGEIFDKKYTCEGENINPEIVFPKSGNYAVLVEDPDAPSGTWFHWGIIVWDSDKIEEGLPKEFKGKNFMQVYNDFYYYKYLTAKIKGIGYDGPCPPKGHGYHRYFFEIFELKKLPEKEIKEKDELIEFIKENAVASTYFISKYKRD